MPRCCVVYWTLVWDYLPGRFTHWAVLGDGARWFGDPGVPYVRCPLCRLRDHRVSIHHCDDNCRGHPGWCGPSQTEWYIDGEVYRLAVVSDN